MKFILVLLGLIFAAFFVNGACQDGQQQSCGYSNEGDCKLGVMICENGEWTVCLGDKGPVNEVCGDKRDNDCDWQTDEECECKTGDERECGSKKGVCKEGVERCVDGSWSGECEGGFIGYPTEFCDNELDDDCDGSVNEGCIVNVSCSDGIQNQDEEGVDCGGSCENECASCSDGIQNQGETGIDCGGPCNVCETIVDVAQPVVNVAPEKNSEDEEVSSYCGDGFCDAGEDEENCSKDCGTAGSREIVFFVIGLVAVIALLAVGWLMYKKFTSKIEKPQKEKKSAFIDLQKIKQLEIEQRKQYKNKTEDELEKSLSRFEKVFK